MVCLSIKGGVGPLEIVDLDRQTLVGLNRPGIVGGHLD